MGCLYIISIIGMIITAPQMVYFWIVNGNTPYVGAMAFFTIVFGIIYLATEERNQL